MKVITGQLGKGKLLQIFFAEVYYSYEFNIY